MYKISKLTGRLYNKIDGILIEIPLDDSTPQFQQYLLDKDIVGVDYIESTPEEIAEANKPIIPEEIAKMHLKIELIKRGIESQEVEDTINAIPSEMFSEIDKKIAITKFNDAVSFDRYNADLQLVATLMGLTQEDLDEIFINGNLLR